MKVTIRQSIFCLALFLTFLQAQAQQSVSIGTTQTNSKAVLLLSSPGKNQGLIVPTVSSTGVVSAGTSDKGMIVFNESDSKAYYFNGTTWVEVGSGSGTGGSSYVLKMAGNDIILEKDGTAQNTIKIASTNPTAAGQFLMWDGSKWVATALSQDVGNSNGAITVTGLQGKALPTLPATTQILAYNGTNWVFQALGGGTDSQDLSLAGTTLSLTNDATPVNLGGLSILNAVSGGPTGTITDGTLIDADVSGTAAIAGSKISPNFGAQNITTTGNLNAAIGTFSGNLNIRALNYVWPTTHLAGVLTNNGTGTLTWAPIPGAISNLTDLTDVNVTGPTAGQVLVYDNTTSEFKNRSLVGDISAVTNTGSVTIANGAINSLKISDGAIADVDVSGTAAIAGTKITPSFGAQNILTTGTLSSGAITATNLASINAVPYTWPNAQGVANTVLTNNGSGVLTWAPPSGGVTGLTDLSDANITSPLAGHMLVYDNTTSEFRNRALSGDIGTVSNLGAVTLANDAVNSLKISNGAIVDVDVSASAAIAGTKISPSFGTQNIVTTGTLSSGAITATNLASIAGVTYAWPTTQGVASTVLTNDGSGTLTWGTLPATFNTLNQVPRGNGTTLVSSNIYSDGTNVGIGATAPRSILELQNGNLILSGSTALPNDPVDIDFKTLTDVFKAKIWTDPSSNTLWISTHTSPTANKYLTLDPNGRFGISSTTPANLLDVEGSVAIGAAYSGTTAAPTNGMIVEGNVGIGTNAPGTSALNVNVAGGVANPDALTVVNAYNGASTKTGISTSVTLDGTGQRYGIENSVNGNSGSGSNVFGVSNLIAPNGSGSTFGTYNNISSVGTGSRFGTYNYVNATASNTSSIYGNYTYVGNSGSGIQYGHNAYITSLGSGKKYGSYLTVYGTSGSASNIYGTYNSFYPNGTGDAFGTFNFIRVNGTGNRYGTYDSVLASASNNQAIYAMYAYTDHAGSGASYGVRVDANKPSGASGSVFGIYNLTNNAGTGTTYGMYVDANKPSGIAGTLYGLYVTSDNDGTSNSYVVRGSSIGSTTATEYGIYISGEDENYLQGSLGVGRLVTTNKLEVNGEASKTTAGGWIANSDRRIKTDIHSIDNALQTIRSLRPVKFKYTDYWLAKNPSIKDRYYYNFIAQEYQQVFPDAVKGSGEYIEGDTKEILQIDTYDAGIVTIRAIQELAEKVEQLEKENAQLKAEKTTVENELRAEIAEIKKMLGTEAKASKKEK